MNNRGLYKLFFLAVLLSGYMVLQGCGSGGSGSTNAGSQAGSVTAQLHWIERTGASSKSAGKQIATAPQGVVTVRIVVSGPDMSNVQQDFPASAGTGVIGGVPVGTNRTLTAQGLDASGVVTHQGVKNDIIVQSGQTTDAGTVVMNPVGQTFTVSGRVTLNGGGLAGVTVSLQGTSYSTITGSDGAYSLPGVPNAPYTIVASMTGFTFAPANRSIPDSNGNVTGQDFTATPIPIQTFTISGRVTLNGSGLAGVTVSLQGTSFTTVTGADGTYALTGVQNGSYTAVPSLAGLTFAPANRSVSVSNGDVTGQDFTATTQTYSISGRVTLNGSGLAGATVTLQGASSNSVTTDSNGNYTFAGVQNGLYTVTPTLAGYTFTPANRSVTVNNGDTTGQDFTAVAQTYGISGRITLNGSGLAGVTVTLQGASSNSVTTDSNGNYAFTGALNGSYTLTPTLTGYSFTPANRSVTVNNGDMTGQDFTASVAPLIVANILSSPTLLNSESVSVFDSTGTTPITNATVIINGSTLPSMNNGYYFVSDGFNMLVPPGATVNLSVTVGGVTYNATGTQYSTFPIVTVPASGATWQASNANTITWTAGAPLALSSYYVYLVDVTIPNSPKVVGQPVEVPTSSTTYTIPANSLAAGSYRVHVGIGTAKSPGGLPISGAAPGSGLWLNGEISSVLITVQNPVVISSVRIQ